ncbi:hypothetical protein LCGC14_1766160, partial [marine sediment metagenome]
TNTITMKPDPNDNNKLKPPSNIDTEFKLHEIEIDLNNPAGAIISLLTWMILEPNIFSVIKWGPNNFLNLDIYNLFDQAYMDSMNVVNPIGGQSIWTGDVSAGDTFTPALG